MHMTEKIFVYGTLQQPEVQIKVIGRVVKSTPDILLGFRKSTIEINSNIYPIIEEDSNSDEEINGLVLDIEEEDLKNLDEYETNAYRREKVTLKSGLLVWVYQK